MKFRTAFSGTAAMLAMGLSSPAQADISALYSTPPSEEDVRPFDFNLTVEVNQAGDARLHVTGRSIYILILKEEVYLVERGIDGIYASRLSDHERIFSENRQVAGLSLDLLGQGLNNVKFTPGEVVVINGREGLSYKEEYLEEHYEDDEYEDTYRGVTEEEQKFEEEYEEIEPAVDLVISNDPALAPIGKAFSATLGQQYGVARTLALAGSGPLLIIYKKPFHELMKNGTPLKISSLELSEISTAEIDPSRFALPERIISYEELKAMYEPFQWAPAFNVQPKG